MSDVWLTTLETATPQEGCELAIKLSRMSVKYIQPDEDVRKKLRPIYANGADTITAAAHVIGVNFQMVAVANSYWRKAA